MEAQEGKRNNYNLKLQNLEKITHFAGVIGGAVPSWLVWWRCQVHTRAELSLYGSDNRSKRIVYFFFLLGTCDIHMMHLTEEWMAIEQISKVQVVNCLKAKYKGV